MRNNKIKNFVEIQLNKEYKILNQVNCKKMLLLDLSYSTLFYNLAIGCRERAETRQSERDFAIGKIHFKLITCDPKKVFSSLLVFQAQNMKRICLRYEVCKIRVTKNV